MEWLVGGLGIVGSLVVGDVWTLLKDKAIEYTTGGRINDLLDQYFDLDDFDTDDLGASLLSGKLKPKKPLVIKEGALNELGLPISVVAGHVGAFEMVVNWKDILYADPIKIKLNDVCIVAAVGKVNDKPDGKEEDSRIKKMKKDFIKRIKKKVDFIMTNVHVRLESTMASDGASGDERPGESSFAMGFTIDSLEVNVKNENTQFSTYKFYLGPRSETDSSSSSSSSEEYDDDSDEDETQTVSDGMADSSSSSSSSEEYDDDSDEDETQTVSDGMTGFALYCSPGTKSAGQPMMTDTKDGITRLRDSTVTRMVGMIGADPKDLDYVVRPIHLAIIYTKDNSKGAPYEKSQLTQTKEGKWMVDGRRDATPIGPEKVKFDTQVLRDKFKDGLYRYAPEHHVVMTAKELRVELDMQVLRYIMTVAHAWEEGAQATIWHEEAVIAKGDRKIEKRHAKKVRKMKLDKDRNMYTCKCPCRRPGGQFQITIEQLKEAEFSPTLDVHRDRTKDAVAYCPRCPLGILVHYDPNDFETELWPKEVDIDDFDEEEVEEGIVYTCECPKCDDLCQITSAQLKDGKARAHCQACQICLQVEYDLEKFEKEDYPEGWIEYQLEFELQKLSLLLKHESQNVCQFDMETTEFTVKLGKAPKEEEEERGGEDDAIRLIDLTGSLQDMEVRDMRTRSTDPATPADPRLSFSLGRASTSGRDRCESTANSSDDTNVMLRRTERRPEENLMKLTFGRNSMYDVDLELRLQPVSIDMDLYRLFDIMSIVNNMIGAVTDPPQRLQDTASAIKKKYAKRKKEAWKRAGSVQRVRLDISLKSPEVKILPVNQKLCGPIIMRLGDTEMQTDDLDGELLNVTITNMRARYTDKGVPKIVFHPLKLEMCLRMATLKKLAADPKGHFEDDEATVNISEGAVRLEPTIPLIEELQRVWHLAFPVDSHLYLRTTEFPNGVEVGKPVTCHSESVGLRSKLFDMGIRWLELRETGKKDGTYDLKFEAWKPDYYVFTDSLGEPHWFDCIGDISYPVTKGISAGSEATAAHEQLERAEAAAEETKRQTEDLLTEKSEDQVAQSPTGKKHERNQSALRKAQEKVDKHKPMIMLLETGLDRKDDPKVKQAGWVTKRIIKAVSSKSVVGTSPRGNKAKHNKWPTQKIGAWALKQNEAIDALRKIPILKQTVDSMTQKKKLSDQKYSKYFSAINTITIEDAGGRGDVVRDSHGHRKSPAPRWSRGAGVATGPHPIGAGTTKLLPQREWIPDADAPSCEMCSSAFRQLYPPSLKSRHHCRSCGHVFCDTCCSEEYPLDDPDDSAGSSKSLVCNECYKTLAGVRGSPRSDSDGDDYSDEDGRRSRTTRRHTGDWRRSQRTGSRDDDDESCDSSDDETGPRPSRSRSRSRSRSQSRSPSRNRSRGRRRSQRTGSRDDDDDSSDSSDDDTEPSHSYSRSRSGSRSRSENHSRSKSRSRSHGRSKSRRYSRSQ